MPPQSKRQLHLSQARESKRLKLVAGPLDEGSSSSSDPPSGSGEGIQNLA